MSNRQKIKGAVVGICLAVLVTSGMAFATENKDESAGKAQAEKSVVSVKATKTQAKKAAANNDAIKAVDDSETENEAQTPTITVSADKSEVSCGYESAPVLKAVVSGADDGAVITYQWYETVNKGEVKISNATKDEYTLEKDLAAGTYLFYCVANVDGEAITSDPIEVVVNHAEETKYEDYKEETCTEDGSYKEIVWCEGCGEVFSEETVTIPALGHTEAEPVKENIIEPTCTKMGSYDEVVYCETCGEELSREPYNEDELGHELTHVKAKAATSTEEGNIEYWYCERCGLYFSDEDAKHEISEEDTIIAAKGSTSSTSSTSSSNNSSSGNSSSGNSSSGSNKSSGSNSSSTTPKTGDEANFALWATAIFFVFAGLGLIGLSRKTRAVRKNIQNINK